MPGGWGDNTGGGGDPGHGLIPTFNVNASADPTGAPPGGEQFMPPAGGQPMPPPHDVGMDNIGNVMTDAMAGVAAGAPQADISGANMLPGDVGYDPSQAGTPDPNHAGMPDPSLNSALV
ncbi:MAG: hypothetical protein HQL74_07870 [Magnetococcales bacterium]|nr:hypothetical protein [Magnetococcales bacterium]